ncbi:MAG: Flp pilus assembly protein CpaB [Acidobacteriota bacterium]
MNRNRMLILGVFALMLSALVTYFVYQSVQRRLQPPEPTTQIVVASQRLALGMRLTEGNVRLASWPKSMTLEGTFTDPKDVVGRGVIVGILTNEPILDSKLAPKEGGAGLTSVIPDGKRAVSLKVDDVIGVAGFVLPGTHVDVIMTGAPKSGDDVTSKTILENAQVLAAGQNVQQDANGKPQTVQVVTLLVSPEQAQDLALAAVGEHIQLALRNPLDSEQKEPAAVKRTSLFDRGGKALPAAPEKPAARPRAPAKPKPEVPVVAPPVAPPPPRVLAVELFQGKAKETVTFPEKVVK